MKTNTIEILQPAGPLGGQVVVAVVVVVARDDLSNDPSADSGSPHQNNYFCEAIKNYTAIKLIQF